MDHVAASERPAATQWTRTAALTAGSFSKRSRTPRRSILAGWRTAATILNGRGRRWSSRGLPGLHALERPEDHAIQRGGRQAEGIAGRNRDDSDRGRLRVAREN